MFFPFARSRSLLTRLTRLTRPTTPVRRPTARLAVEGLEARDVPATWTSHLTADFTGDGKADVADFDANTGSWHVRRSTGSGLSDGAIWTDYATNIGWQTHKTADFNGDGRADIASFLPANGTWLVSLSTGSGFRTGQWADYATNSGWETHLAADFTGDGRADIASYHPATGTWWVSSSTGAGLRPAAQWTFYGTRTGWQTHLAADFTGDGRADIASYHPSNGTWWVSSSTGAGFTTTQWADYATNSGWETHLAADFTGDGRTDIASYHPATGTWWVSSSTGAGLRPATQWTFYGTRTGWQTHLAADFTGDGRADIASYHPSNGTWWVSRATSLRTFTTTEWSDYGTDSGWRGQSAGDFNGDGRADVANFHPSNATWWVGRSTAASFDTTRWADLPDSLNASLDGGVLTVRGTGGADTVRVRQVNGALSVDNTRIVYRADAVSAVSTALVSKIVVETYGGNDTLDLNSGAVSLRTEAWLAEGDDTLFGGSGADTVYGGYGNDTLYGRGGSDRLYGEAGGDRLYGGDGDDYLDGGADHDPDVDGGAGTDTYRRKMTITGMGFNSQNDNDNGVIGAPDDDEGELADTPENVAGAFLTEIAWRDSPFAVEQWGTPTCAFLASLASVADQNLDATDLVQAIVYDAAADVYRIPLYVGGVKTYFAVNGDWTEGRDPGGALWVTLYQNAYLQAMSVRTSDWVSTTGVAWDTATVALRALTGAGTVSYDVAAFDAATLRAAVDAGRAVVASSRDDLPRYGTVVGNHAYAVMGVSADGGTVTLYNPWGDDREGSSLDGTNDGIITLTWDEFVANFEWYTAT